MTRITGDDFMLIGLHRMAAERGDGFSPEMLDALTHSRDGLNRQADLPGGRGELGRTFPERIASASTQDNIIMFPVARRRATSR